MATPARQLQEGRRTLVRRGPGTIRLVKPIEPDLPTHQIRTCTHCGAHTWFRLEDPEGGWYTCSRCGHFA
jgi:PHP family Zn ribbon phosphoesterase